MPDSDFSQLPEELTHLVLERLNFVEDFVRFGAACKSGRSVVEAAIRRKRTPIFPPALMLVNDDDDYDDLRTFSCLSTKREITIKLPGICGRRCWGTPYGWIITFGLDFNFHLLNPFTGAQLPLPPASTLPGLELRGLVPEHGRLIVAQKLFLSSDPSLSGNQSSFVIAVHLPDSILSFARPGDQTWTLIETPTKFLCDAIYFNGHAYAIDYRGMLTVCDMNTPSPKGMHIGNSIPKRRTYSDQTYLLDLCGELHVVVRGMTPVHYEPTPNHNKLVTGNIFVYKFDFQTTSWIAVTNLGDHALFVGNNTSFAISTKDYPDFKHNAIYFGDDQPQIYWNTFCDMLVYDLEMKTREPFYMGDNVISEYSRPIFIIPSV